jgi:hypothetical protein
VFTLRNPAATSPRKFSLSARGYAIYCHPIYGPTFGNHSIYVADNSDGNLASYTNLGNSYANHTGGDGKTFLTGAYNFRVMEVEVFELVAE